MTLHQSPLEAAPLLETPDNPMPPGGEAFFVEPAPGVRVRGAFWRGTGPRRGTVLILPGRTEIIEKYFEVTTELLARDFAVLVIDWRGQGASTRLLSDPLKGFVADYADYVGDLRAALGRVEADCPKPLMLLGHSMGGNIALRALHAWPERFGGAVLTAPLTRLSLKVPRLAALVACLAPGGWYVPGGKDYDPYTEPFGTNIVTHDERRFLRNRQILETYRALALGGTTWGWLKATFKSIRFVRRRRVLRSFKTSVLLLSAEQERLVDNDSHVRTARALRSATHVVISGARHELLNETDALRAQAWRHIDEFFARAASS